jgi:GAF domain-containing protein
VWVLKNRQHLIVTDISKDFRFDLSNEPMDTVRSLIIAPIVDDGKIIGLLRI